MNERNWHLIYTKPGTERKVTEALTRKGIASYLPVTNSGKPRISTKKGSVPVFRDYVFAFLADTQATQVMKTDGVINFVYWLGNPVVVRESDIQLLRDFLAEHNKVRVETTKVNPKEMVRIVTSPVVEQDLLNHLTHRSTVRINIPSIGYMIVAEVEVSNVGLFNNPASSNRKEALAFT